MSENPTLQPESTGASAGQELHGMLAKHGKLLTEALEAVQVRPPAGR